MKGCVCDYTGRPMQLGRPFGLWRARPPSPRQCVGLPILVCMLLQGKERESEEVEGVEEVSDRVVCASSSAYFFRPDVFTVHRFLALCLGVVMGHFVDCKSLTPTQGATQQSVDCESLTPTQAAMQQSVDCESLTPT